MHYGATAPSLEIAPQWRIATVQTLKRGRPRRKAGGLDPSAEQINAERPALDISKVAHQQRTLSRHNGSLSIRNVKLCAVDGMESITCGPHLVNA